MYAPPYSPVAVSDLDISFGGTMADLLPAYDSIPDELKSWSNPWNKWVASWFFNGLDHMPEAKEGVDAAMAVRHLRAIMASWEPKHEHKSAGVAYLASLWYKAPSPERKPAPEVTK